MSLEKRSIFYKYQVHAHSFWFQVWGLPFEFITEEVGKDIGGTIGNFLEVDKHSWQSNQAKFMHIRVDIQINRPLQRGGYVSSLEGGKHWVTFKYKRLPTIYFICGRIGHDVKHCSETTNWQEAEKQYGEWMRASWNSKGGPSKTRTTNSEDQATADMGTGSIGCRAPTDNLSIPESTGLGGNNISDENPALGNVSMVNVATNQTALLLQAAEN